MAIPSNERTELLLTLDEERLLSEDQLRDTAYAVQALGVVATELGIESVEDVADKLREALDQMQPRDRRRTRKAWQRIAEGVSGLQGTAGPHSVLEMHLAKLGETQGDPEEVPDQTYVNGPAVHTQDGAEEPSELVDLAIDSDSDFEAEVGTEAETPAVFERDRVKQFYKSINKNLKGEALPFEPYDQDEAMGLVALYALTHLKGTGPGLVGARRISLWLEGKSREDILSDLKTAGDNANWTAIRQLLTVSAGVTLASKIKDGAFEGKQKIKRRQNVAPLTKPVAETGIEVDEVLESQSGELPRDQDDPNSKNETVFERSLDDEPRHVQLAYRIGEAFGFDPAETSAFAALINPQNHSGVHLGPAKLTACEKICKSIIEKGGDLTWSELQLNRGELYRLRKILGFNFDIERNTAVLRSPIHLSELRRQAQRDGSGSPQQEDAIVNSGLRKIIKTFAEEGSLVEVSAQAS